VERCYDLGEFVAVDFVAVGPALPAVEGDAQVARSGGLGVEVVPAFADVVDSVALLRLVDNGMKALDSAAGRLGPTLSTARRAARRPRRPDARSPARADRRAA
jgi:hypothetical protein